MVTSKTEKLIHNIHAKLLNDYVFIIFCIQSGVVNLSCKKKNLHTICIFKEIEKEEVSNLKFTSVCFPFFYAALPIAMVLWYSKSSVLVDHSKGF